MIPDISHWHPVRDWATFKKNTQFAISKATQGTNYVDPTLKSFIAGCERNGIPYFLYTFLNRGNELSQTQYMERVCRPLVGKYFRGYCLDVESGNSPVGVQKALKYLESKYSRVILYTMYAQYSTYAPVIRGRSAKTCWWEARYGLNNGVFSPRYGCHAGADLHQYTSKGYQPGVGSGTDLSRLTGTKPLSWFVGTAKQATKPTPAKPAAKKPANNAKKPIATIAAEVLAGKYGNGTARTAALKRLGYSPAEIKSIQLRVNQLVEGERINNAARAVLAGRYGNGILRKRRLRKAGYSAAEIKAIQARVNQLIK